VIGAPRANTLDGSGRITTIVRAVLIFTRGLARAWLPLYRRGVLPSNEPAEQVSDSALVSRMAAGDRSAVAALYARHVRALFVLARSMLKNPQEAEDLIHDVFLEAWRRSADYSAERGSVRAWLFMRARSRALDRLKSAGRPLAVLNDAVCPSLSPVDDQGRLRELLAKMPAVQQQVLILGYFEGLSTSEIAARLGVPAGTVKSRTRAALGALRSILGANDG
jgi:RNA polymerase sigma-70 factor (ECF subfamily)